MPSGREIEAVQRALAGAPAGLSTRAKCNNLAKKVLDCLLADAEVNDPFGAMLKRTLLAFDDEPAYKLATDPDIDIPEILFRERIKRFRARECRQVSTEAWERETRELRALIERRLSERFRKYADIGENVQISPKRQPNKVCVGLKGKGTFHD